MEKKYIKTEGIILSTYPYLESDSLLKILSKDLGLISAIARGARKVTSKRAGVIQPFNRAFFELYAGKNLYTVVQTKGISLYASQATSFMKAVAMMFASELIIRTQEEGQVIAGAYELLKAFFDTCKKVSDQSSLVYLAGFFLSYLRLLGYRLDLDACEGCGVSLSLAQKGFFSESGRFSCQSCSDGEEECLQELKAIVRSSFLLESFARINPTYPFASKLTNEKNLKPSCLLSIFRKLESYLAFHIGAKIESFLLLSNTIETEL